MKPREPIPVAPFLAWCQTRIEQLTYELDAYPAIGLTLEGVNPHARLMLELGWDPDTGGRRLLRWASAEHMTGMGERALIEDALHHAGVAFEDVYPAIESARAQPDKLGQGHRMTDAQIVAAHTIYNRTGMSLRALGELLWQRYGYIDAASCTQQLRRSFHNRGLPVRTIQEGQWASHYKHGMTVGGKTAPMYKRTLKLQRDGPCAATRKDGTPCPRAARPGTDRCGYHNADEIERRRTQMAQVNARRAERLAA